MISEHDIEEWKPVPIPGFEKNYEISSLGRVKRSKEVVRRKGRGRMPAGVILSQDMPTSGYKYVSLYSDGKRKGVAVHRLVALAFLGDPPPNHEVCHNDGTRSNNTLKNLRWGTRSENNIDKHKHGTAMFGKKNHMARLTDEAVEVIKLLHEQRWTNRKIAKVFGVSEGTISFVVIGSTWRHLQK